METIPAQPATQASASFVTLIGSPGEVAEESFATTLGRALDSASTPDREGGPSGAKLAPRTRSATDKSDSSGTAASPLCALFAGSFPAPTVPMSNPNAMSSAPDGAPSGVAELSAAKEAAAVTATTGPIAFPLLTALAGPASGVARTFGSDGTRLPDLRNASTAPASTAGSNGSPSPTEAASGQVATSEFANQTQGLGVSSPYFPELSRASDYQTRQFAKAGADQESPAAAEPTPVPFSLGLGNSPSLTMSSLTGTQVPSVLTSTDRMQSGQTATALSDSPQVLEADPFELELSAARAGGTAASNTTSASSIETVSVPGGEAATASSGSDGLAEFSGLLANFTGVSASLKATGLNAAGEGTPSVSVSTAIGTGNSGPAGAAAGRSRGQPSPNSEGIVSHAAEVSRAAQSSAGQCFKNGPEAVTLPDAATPSEQASAGGKASHSGPSSTAVASGDHGKQAAAEDGTSSTSISPHSASADAQQPANPQDDTGSNGEKRGQQTAPAGTVDPGTGSSALANGAGTDPGTNLLSAHTPVSPASHAGVSTGTPEATPSQSPEALAAWQNYESSTGKIVTSAHLSGGGEMRVELRSGTLGPVEVRAVLREGSVGAEIHVEGHEAHNLLASSLPSLERALGERDLRIGNLSVYQDQAGGSMAGGERQNSHSGSPPPSQGQARHWEASPRFANSGDRGNETEETPNPTGGLSVRV